MNNTLLLKLQLAILIPLVIVITLVLISLESDAKRIVVHKNESEHNEIQKAIDAANPHDTVFISNGTYYESILINKSIHIIGEQNTILIGSNKLFTISVDYENSSLRNLSILKNNNTQTGIIISSRNVVLNNIQINQSYYYSIFISNSDNIQIIDSKISYGIYGVVINNSKNILINNNVFTNNSNGIMVWESQNIICKANEILENEKGISLRYSNINALISNIYINNTIGNLLVWSNSNRIENNSFFQNKNAIWIKGNHNILTYNIFQHNNISNWINGPSNQLMNNIYSNNTSSIVILENSNNLVNDNKFFNNTFTIEYIKLPKHEPGNDNFIILRSVLPGVLTFLFLVIMTKILMKERKGTG